MVLLKQIRDSRIKKPENTPHGFVNCRMQFHVVQDKYDC